MSVMTSVTAALRQGFNHSAFVLTLDQKLWEVSPKGGGWSWEALASPPERIQNYITSAIDGVFAISAEDNLLYCSARNGQWLSLGNSEIDMIGFAALRQDPGIYTLYGLNRQRQLVRGVVIGGPGGGVRWEKLPPPPPSIENLGAFWQFQINRPGIESAYCLSKNDNLIQLTYNPQTREAQWQNHGRVFTGTGVDDVLNMLAMSGADTLIYLQGVNGDTLAGYSAPLQWINRGHLLKDHKAYGLIGFWTITLTGSGTFRIYGIGSNNTLYCLHDERPNQKFSVEVVGKPPK